MVTLKPLLREEKNKETLKLLLREEKKTKKLSQFLEVRISKMPDMI